MWIVTVLAGVAVALEIAWINATITNREHGPMPKVVLLLGTIGFFVISVGLLSVKWRRARSRAKSLRGMSCPHCEYELPLQSSPTSNEQPLDACAECGAVLTLSQLAEHWDLPRIA